MDTTSSRCVLLNKLGSVIETKDAIASLRNSSASSAGLGTGLSEADTRTPAETASYLAYHANERWDIWKRSYKRVTRRFNVYAGFCTLR